MTDSDYLATVTRAKQGDPGAFTELVIRFQDLAVATAYGWLGDIEMARDVAQEAFFEVHRQISQLREPAAFPAWFRRIITKHCDRITRRRQIDIVPIEVADKIVALDCDPEITAVDNEQIERLRFAVDSLPVSERMIVALHYFAETSQPELSSFLELPLSTIKKRLRSARRRLLIDGDQLMQRTINNMRPSATQSFSRDINFFIALRSGQHQEVKRLLATAPDLVEKLQDWDPTLVQEGVLPFANKATPLITAIERNDLVMQKLLLDAGADVNGCCGCTTSEAPIWAATLLQRFAHAQQLLQHGADPNAISSSGNRPLHLAAMRGMTDMTRLLLKYGADPNALDLSAQPLGQWSPADDLAGAAGRTAADWATANGHLELAELILGFILGVEGAASTEKIPASANVAVPRGALLPTGIKALDLFAPLRRGSLLRLPFMAGVGMLVLLGELCQRFLALDSGTALWTGFTQRPFDLSDWETDMSEFGLRDQLHSSLADFKQSPQTRRDAFLLGLDTAEKLRDAGHNVLVVILSAKGFEADIDTQLLRLQTTSAQGSIASIIVTPFQDNEQIHNSSASPYTGQIVLDRVRARRALYPAIHPGFTTSDALDPALVGERHMRLAAECRQIIDQYQQLDPEFQKFAKQSTAAESAGSGVALQLLRYLCQPFNTTEPFTGRPGEQVALPEMLDQIEAILATTDSQSGSNPG